MARQSDALQRVIPISYKTRDALFSGVTFAPDNPALEVSNGFAAGVNLGTFYRKLAEEHPDPTVRAHAAEFLDSPTAKGMGCCCGGAGMGNWISQGNGVAVDTDSGATGTVVAGSWPPGSIVPGAAVRVGGTGGAQGLFTGDGDRVTSGYSAPAPTSVGASAPTTTFGQDLNDFSKAFSTIFTPVAGAGITAYNMFTGKAPPQAQVQQVSTTPSWVLPVVGLGLVAAVAVAVMSGRGAPAPAAEVKKSNAPKRRRSRLVVY